MSDIYQKLENDLQWREKELDLLGGQFNKASQESVRQTLLRVMVMLLYAHYEGFCKFAFNFYLKEIEKGDIKRKNCQDVLILLSLEKEFANFRKNTSAENILNFYQNELLNYLESNIIFSEIDATDANLYPSKFREKLAQLGLQSNLVEQHKTEIKNLVGIRNDIAHGQQNIIRTLEEYKKYEDAVLEVIYELAVIIIEGLDQQQYLKNP